MSRWHINKPWSSLPKDHSFTAYWASRCTSTKLVRVYVCSYVCHSPLSYLWTVLVYTCAFIPWWGFTLISLIVLHFRPQISTEHTSPFIVELICLENSILILIVMENLLMQPSVPNQGSWIKLSIYLSKLNNLDIHFLFLKGCCIKIEKNNI